MGQALPQLTPDIQINWWVINVTIYSKMTTGFKKLEILKKKKKKGNSQHKLFALFCIYYQPYNSQVDGMKVTANQGQLFIYFFPSSCSLAAQKQKLQLASWAFLS